MVNNGWRLRKEEMLQLWTKAVDRATAPGLPARHQARLRAQVLLQSHSLSAKRGSVKCFYLGAFREAGTTATGLFFSTVKCNLLKVHKIGVYTLG